MQTVLALDLATNTGLAYGPVGGKPKTQPLRLGGNSASPAEKGIDLMRFLRDWFKVGHPTLVVVEAPLNVAILAKIGATADTIKLTHGLPLVVDMVCNSVGIYRVAYVNVQDVREHFLGQRTFKEGYDVMRKKKISSRQMAKQATINVCRMRGWEVENDDCADAAATWSYGCALLNPRTAIQATPLFGRIAPR